MVVYEPVGVVAAIVPWNSQLHLAAFKIAPALAAGNTIVLKPSEQASAALLEFAQILADRDITVSVRKSRGRDIRAACGQLIVEGGSAKSAAQQLALLMH